MISEPGTFDLADKVMLIHSMMKINERNMKLAPDRLDRLDRVAKYAAQALVDLVEVNKGWDGVRWYERLEDTGAGSLAHRLLHLAAKDFGPESRASNPFDESGFSLVQGVVTLWLMDQGIAMSDQEQWL